VSPIFNSAFGACLFFLESIIDYNGNKYIRRNCGFMGVENTDQDSYTVVSVLLHKGSGSTLMRSIDIENGRIYRSQGKNPRRVSGCP
jgi:hypothetical protein